MMNQPGNQRVGLVNSGRMEQVVKVFFQSFKDGSFVVDDSNVFLFSFNTLKNYSGKNGNIHTIKFGVSPSQLFNEN